MIYPAIIGPLRAVGWKELFGYKEQFGTGTTTTTDSNGGTVSNAFAGGTGTLYPFASIPIAQAWRYYWAVKQWRVRTNTVVSGTAYASDTGFIPYPCGYNSSMGGVQQRGTWTGDTLATPTLAERYYLTTSGLTITPDYYIGFGIFAYTPIIVSLMGQFYYPPYSKYQNKLGLVWDETTPGNVFMSFAFVDGSLFSTTFPMGSPTSVVGTLYLDGMTADLYGDAGSVSGTVIIDTKDTA